MACRAAASAGQRRRMRALRCHWRHDKLSVRVAVAAAVHHSRDLSSSVQMQIHKTEFVIHDTEFSDMRLNMSTVSPLDVSSDIRDVGASRRCFCASVFGESCRA